MKLSKLPDPGNSMEAVRALRARPWIDVVLQVTLLAYVGLVLGLSEVHARTNVPHVVFAALTLLSVLSWGLRGWRNFLSLVFRIAAAMSLVVMLDVSRTAEGKRVADELLAALLLPAIYLGAWPGLALRAYSKGSFVKKWQWLFAPLSLLMWSHWTPFARAFLPIILVEGALLVLVMPVLEDLKAYEWIVALACVCFALWIVFLIVQGWVAWARDRACLRRTIGAMVDSKDFREVLSWLGQFRMTETRVEGLRALRRSGVFERPLAHFSPDSARELLSCLEVDRWAPLDDLRELRREAKNVTDPPRD